MGLLDEEGDEKPERRRGDMRPTIIVSSSLLLLALSVAWYGGGAFNRLANVELAIGEIRGDLRELRHDVERVDVRTAAMQRRNGIIDEPVTASASSRTRNP